ncbi:MAG TPA: HAEPLYID family protein, partial [Cyclobacteriaceae bacterium]|nr:HAEPLYID family protein [Cyclobacteriaceae bacterium]
LFIDLIRDLGARKGEKEWNVGMGLTDNTRYDEYEALIEYEWAPINRLGLEVELPFTFYYPVNGETNRDSIPRNKLNSLKMAAQWSFFVSTKLATTLALGYLHEFEITPFEDYGKKRFFEGNIFNPFFIAAKRWGLNYHTLVYAGPVIEKRFGNHPANTHMQINTNFHYMIPGTRNFIGLEVNKEVYKNDFDMILRPQLRVGITDNVLIGIVTGIPVQRENERFSSFFRLIYEPGH